MKSNQKQGDFDYSNYWLEDRSLDYYALRYDSIKESIVLRKSLGVDESKILDFGGGDGSFLDYLGIKATILDISDTGIKKATAKGYKTIIADMKESITLSNTFKVVYCFEVLEHIHNPKDIVSEIYALLETGGYLIIGQPNTPIDGAHHVVRIYINELKEWLMSTGFLIEDVQYLPAYNHWQGYDFLKVKHIIAWCLGCIPYRIRLFLAKIYPNRFALMYFVLVKKV